MNNRKDSISSPKNSILTGFEVLGLNTSIMPPLLATSPIFDTWNSFSYPIPIRLETNSSGLYSEFFFMVIIFFPKISGCTIFLRKERNETLKIAGFLITARVNVSIL